MRYSKGYFEPQTYETGKVDELGHALQFTIGKNSRDGDGELPQVQVTVLQYGSNDTNYWIDLDKLDEVITALAWAKHRMEEETSGENF